MALGTLSGILFGAVAWSISVGLPATATGEELRDLVLKSALAAVGPCLLAGWLAVGRPGASSGVAEAAVYAAGYVIAGAALGTFVVIALYTGYEDPGGEIAPYLLVGQVVILVPIAGGASLAASTIRHLRHRGRPPETPPPSPPPEAPPPPPPPWAAGGR